MKILVAIDPGNVQSGFTILRPDYSIISKGIALNDALWLNVQRVVYDWPMEHNHEKLMPWDIVVAIEEIRSYGMGVGATVFDTVWWSGRFYEHAKVNYADAIMLPRMAVKMNICHTSRAKDTNITIALVDRFATGQRNYGKGTKAKPGFFFGFKKDIWQSYALGVTVLDGMRSSGVLE